MSDSNVFKGISIHWLLTGFQQDLKKFGKNNKSTIRSLEDVRIAENGMIRHKGANITCPHDCDFGAAYCDCIVGKDNVGSANMLFLHSHNWSNTIGDVVQTLSDHCTSKNLDPKRCYVWIDFLCVNLHRVASSMQNGKWNASEEFQKTVLNVREICANKEEQVKVNVLVLMSPWSKPSLLNNLWTIYEMYLYINCDDDDAIELKFGMSLEERTSMIRSVVADPDLLLELTQQLKSLNVETIDYINDDVSERNAILGMIKDGPGNKEVENWARYFLENGLVDEICADFAGTNIGLVLQSMDELEESLVYLKKALLLREVKLGIYCCETSDSYNSVGDVYFALEIFDQGMEMYKVSLLIEKKLHGINHSRTATSFNNLGKIYDIMGNSDEAMAYLMQALAIREEILGKHSPDVAASYSCIAAAHSRTGDLHEALANYKNALAIHEILHGGDLETAALLNNIAMAHCDKEEYKESLPYFERAIQIYGDVVGENHSHTQVTTQSYSDVVTMLCEQ
eukprot:scaffold3140_cov231-Chaetoceros_neogracile.AAC.3